MGPNYLSPSSINQWIDDPEEFFLKYIVRVPRQPQTKPMAIGSAFDSCIKSYLVSSIVEDNYSKKRHKQLYYEYLADTVEPHLFNWAKEQGIIIFNMYKETGVLEHLLQDIVPGSLLPLESLSQEVEVEGCVVPLLGKPDLLWDSRSHGCKIVDDWKCNGACSKYNKSPNPGYVDLFPSRALHKSCILEDGVNTQPVHPMYLMQLTIYKVLTGAEIVGINQLVFGTCVPPTLGTLRVALHRHRISKQIVRDCLQIARDLWLHIQNYTKGMGFGNIISAERCEQLLLQGEMLKDPTVRMLSGR